MTLVDAKYDNFTRLIYDAVTPVWKLLFEKKMSGTFWHLVASKKESCKEQALIDPELQIKKKCCLKKEKSAYVFFVFIVIFETYMMLFIKNYTHMI